MATEPTEWQDIDGLPEADVASGVEKVYLAEGASDKSITTGNLFASLLPKADRSMLRSATPKIINILGAQPSDPIRVVCMGDSVAYYLWDNLRVGLQAAYGNAGAGFSALNIAITGGVTQVLGDYTNWITGAYYSVPAGGAVTWTAAPSGMDTLDVYYVKESGAGTFKIQSNNGGGWVDELTVDASNAGKAGAYATVAKAAGQYDMRVVGVTGVVKIINGAILSSGSGIALLPLNLNGIQLSDMMTCPVVILSPILQRLNPDVVHFEMKDTAAIFTQYLQVYHDRITGIVPGADMIYCTSNPVDPDVFDNEDQTEQNKILARHAEKNHALLFDGAAAWGGYEEMDRAGFISDGVHPNSAGQFFIAQNFSRAMGLLGPRVVYINAGIIERVRINGSPIGQTTRAKGAFTEVEITTPLSRANGGTGQTTKPICAYRKSANLVAASGTDYVLTVDAGEGDVDGIWDGSTFTAPRSGWVQFIAGFAADGAPWYVRWVRGGTTEYILTGNSPFTAGSWPLLVQLNQGETMQLKVEQGSGSDKTIYAGFSTRIGISYVD